MKKIICFLILAVFLTSCASTTYMDAQKADTTKKEYPVSYMIEDSNNYFDYQQNYECSAYSSSYVLRHYGEEADGITLFKTIPDKLPNDSGVYPSGIVKMFEKKGYDASFMVDASIDTLKYEVSKGAPVIVYIHVEADADTTHCTHYVPVIGYDEEYLYFAESLDYKANAKDEKLPYNRKTEISEFMKLWENIEGIWNYPYFQITK